MVIKGYRIPFARKPPLKKLSRENIWRYQTQVSQDMDIEIQRLLKDKALRRSYQKSGFLSTMFLKKKSNGEIRPMFNLKNLNQYLSIPKFHLINHFQIPLHLRRNDFMMKIDISQAYFHIPVNPGHRRFLSLSYRGTVYEMTCLPFGLASAPSIFAKVTNWMPHQLRLKGIAKATLVYLDDFLIFHEGPIILEDQARTGLFENLDGK